MMLRAALSACTPTYHGWSGSEFDDGKSRGGGGAHLMDIVTFEWNLPEDLNPLKNKANVGVSTGSRVVMHAFCPEEVHQLVNDKFMVNDHQPHFRVFIPMKEDVLNTWLSYCTKDDPNKLYGASTKQEPRWIFLWAIKKVLRKFRWVGCKNRRVIG